MKFSRPLNINFLFVLAATLFVSLTTLAETTEKEASTTLNAVATTSAAAAKWKVGLMSYYYDIKGKKAADNLEYDFDQITTRLDLMNLSYTLSPTWTLSVLLQHYELYAQTIFPKLAGTVYAESFDRSVGAGDTYLTLTTPIAMQNSWMFLADFGVSLPTGTINNKSYLPGFETINLAYNAQHGSGTVDFLGGVTALSYQPKYNVGSRFSTALHTGENTNGYTLGNMYRLDSWYEYNLAYGFSPKLTGFYRQKEAIHGFDKTRGELLGDSFYRHEQINWDVSAALKFQYLIPTTPFTFGAEVGVPVAQGSRNSDNAEVVTNYYSSVSLNGSF